MPGLKLPPFAPRTGLWDSSEFIREELFAVDRLRQHAESLARAQPVSSRKKGGRELASRLRDNERVLFASYLDIAAAVENGRPITPAAEWILDNYHIVEEQIVEVRGDLPPSYYRQLPKLTAGPFAGLPRVFGVAWAYIAHTDSRFDGDLLCEFVDAYQAVQPLTIGELWAVPITLRIILVENLRRAAGRIVRSHQVRREADEFADRVLGLGAKAPEPIAQVLADYPSPYLRTFIVQLAHRLRDPTPAVAPAVHWLEQQVASTEGDSVDSAVQAEHRVQAEANVTVRNIITSMRAISAIEWPDIFERISLVDAELRKAGNFAAMDFPTRDAYRREIERLARGSHVTELEITRRAIELAGAAAAREEEERRREPGYYLLTPAGLKIMEDAVTYRPSFGDLARRLSRAAGVGGFIGVCTASAVLIVAAVVWALSGELAGPGLLLFGCLSILLAVDLAATVISRTVLAFARSVALPAMDLQSGVPADLRTLVVIPTLLSSPRAIEKAVERLEIHYLSNASDDLTFALLTDWADAAGENMPEDRVLLEVAVKGITRLNGAHPRRGSDRFLLLHRKRVWNDTQDCWMGWERKRGKLQELNRLLRGATDTTFIPIDGRPPTVPTGVRFVLTLDSDTQLPRDTIPLLVGKMAHVLNRPHVDRARQLVVEGYGILQPRVTLALPHGSEGSWFQRTFSGATGMDPYAAPVSDIYQDLFGEGSFLGKGIYDVDAFEAVMEGRTPDNAILSHDLFEGIFARAGLAGDVEVVEEFPRRYDVATSRQHRWARGDWQLLGWLFVWPRRRGNRAPATLLGRWKMLDNLRRTLSAPLTVLALIAGWTLSPLPSFMWSAFVLVTLAAPALLPALLGVFSVAPKSSWRLHFSVFFSALYVAVGQTGFVIATLVHQGQLMIDAQLRTWWRLAVTRKRLLEWTTAEQASSRAELSLAQYYRWMGLSPVVAAAGAAISFVNSPATSLIALPFVLAWAAAPAIAYEASRARKNPALAALTADHAKELRAIARDTWRYFETFVTARDNWLPPDNFQEAFPQPALAHRTSPTNIGLYLLAITCAYDFGWLGLADAIERAEATFGTLRKMFRFRGHFYNWYDTEDLRPLEPQYVSSVDSGNLAGHLIAVANACEAAAREVTSNTRCFAGIGDALALVRRAIEERSVPSRDVAKCIVDLENALRGSGQASDGPAIAARLAELGPLAQALVDAAHSETPPGTGEDAVVVWAEAAARTIESHGRDLAGAPTDLAGAPADLGDRLIAIAHTAREMALQMDFRFMIDPQRKLMSIGYIPAESRQDPNVYDMLASEARLASFFAIAKGDTPTKHWFKLGRKTTVIDGEAALISWSGSMFEYLMPSLIMRAPAGSLLETTHRLIVRRQIEYGGELGLPWGISESAYNARDIEFTYQYSNFGVPGLGLKRGLSANRVIAPYATGLAAMVDPVAALRNYAAITDAGGRGRFGYFEALDYTPSRVPVGDKVAVVHAFMAHHQGMTVVALANVIFSGRTRGWFHTEPMVAASELLLEERNPQATTAVEVRADAAIASDVRPAMPSARRQFDTARTVLPQVGLLSNTRYSIMMTAAGSGYSRWTDQAVTRWQADSTLDDCGSYIYLRDTYDRRVWSAGYQPTALDPDTYSVSFGEDRIRITRRDRTLTTTMEVTLSTEEDAEVRRVSLTNIGGMERQIDLTSYAEVVLNAPAEDAAHPAFSKMFVQTEFLPDRGVLLATRRKRSPDAPSIWAAHFAVVEGPSAGDLQFETDRAKFIGVGGDLRAPAALDGRALSNTAGIVLDPIFSLRRRVLIRPGTTVRVSFWTVVGESREAVLESAAKYNDVAAFDRAATLAWTHAQVQLRHIDLTSAEASLFQRLAACILYPERDLRAADGVLANPAFDVRALWAHGISGDLPIVLLRIDSEADVEVARELVLAHEYLRLKRLSFDLVILNERGSSYAQELQQSLEAMARISETRLHPLRNEGKTGKIFVVRRDLTSDAGRQALSFAARALFVGSRGPLAVQLERFAQGAENAPAVSRPRRPSATKSPPAGELEFANGLGGFADDGREYVTVIEDGNRPPTPWVNVIANPVLGFQISADGASHTWAVNSHDNQLTPWSNDPVINRSGEALYIRDDESGELWGPTAHPFQNPGGTYRASHGRGYSRFKHAAAEIVSELTAFVPTDDAVKIMRLRLTNTSERSRRLSVAAYAEWVLGPSRAHALHIVTEMAGEGAILARNAHNSAYPGRVAFLALGSGQASWTADRAEFLGRHGSTAEPAALLARVPLSGHAGTGLDPCAAFLAPLQLEPGETQEVVILLGEAASREGAEETIAKYRSAKLDDVLAAVTGQWDEILRALVVTTPDRSMDLMLNGWLLYQTLACRMWARSGFYQASGAYGFRDQLQDCLALVFAAPALAREHILRAAARQFPEGDVQHWWLPTTGQGVRTRIADDPVWLAYAVATYVEATGDDAILDVPLAYLEGPRLADHEQDAFFEPTASEKSAPLYQHCVDAIEHSLATGAHGLPLMGAGDWNDGMNRVGIDGKGESVWLAWFQCKTLTDFAALAAKRHDDAYATRWRAHGAELASAVERDGWDGDWYRRAFFDDGTPLGSASNDECQIDSIAQSWAVISGAAPAERATIAMTEAERQLIDNDDRLALLFTPAFDETALEPGYIKGYPPGLRENGGQYTHAACWFVIAQAMQGKGDKAAALFAMLNPVNHALTREGVARYKVEPYVVAADVYSAAGHAGRGGWTWYTGSAGWLYRAGVEWILGLRKEGNTLHLEPAIPASWSGFRANLRHGSARYEITVQNPAGTAGPISALTLDGAAVPHAPAVISLCDDGKVHQVTAVLG
ncbi:MAG TPA: glucoamylase family protein [Bauldia sp.]